MCIQLTRFQSNPFIYKRDTQDHSKLHEINYCFSGKYTRERTDLKESFTASVKKATEVFKEAWKMSSRELWRCDPAKHEKGWANC